MNVQSTGSSSSSDEHCRSPKGDGGRAIRVLIVAETLLYRRGLAAILGQDERLEIVAAAGTTAAGVDLVAVARPDAVLLDVSAEGGLRALRRMRQASADVRVVAFGVAESEQVIIEWAEAGASGYVARDCDVEQLSLVIEAALRDEVVCTPGVAGTLMRRVGALARRSGEADNGETRLTPRETQIIGLIDEGLSNKEIARRLQIELPTVKNHVHHLIQKVGARGRAEAAARVRAMRTEENRTLGPSGIRIPD
jgi:two-component system, NarL family, nitrate/nitrite response regulator NarL